MCSNAYYEIPSGWKIQSCSGFAVSMSRVKSEGLYGMQVDFQSWERMLPKETQAMSATAENLTGAIGRYGSLAIYFDLELSQNDRHYSGSEQNVRTLGKTRG